MPNAFAHIELNTSDLAGSRTFYKTVFGWKMFDLPDGSYTMIDVGKGTGGGMQTKPMPEAPTAWLPYVRVASVKVALLAAVQAGARVALDYTDIGEMGAIGVFVDPAGASLGVWEARTSPKKAAKRARKAAKKAAKRTAKVARPEAKAKAQVETTAKAKPVAAARKAKATPTTAKAKIRAASDKRGRKAVRTTARPRASTKKPASKRR